MIVMGKTMEQMVNDKFGVKIDEIALDLMMGRYVVTEISQESDGRTIDTTVSMMVNGSEMSMKLSKRVGF